MLIARQNLHAALFIYIYIYIYYIQTLIDWASVGRTTTTEVPLSAYAIKNGNQLSFAVRATDLAGNTGKSSTANPIVVDTTPPLPGRFTDITLTGINDGKKQRLLNGGGNNF